MKKLIIAVLACGVLSGCAGTIPMNDSSVKDISNHDVFMCASGLRIPNDIGGEFEDSNGLCFNEVKDRLASHKMSQAEVESFQDEVNHRLPIQQAQDEREAQERASYSESHSQQPGLIDSLVAAQECSNNPIICRAHMVGSDLNNAGW